MSLQGTLPLTQPQSERVFSAVERRSIANERKAWLVAILSLLVMAAEVCGGLILNSVALMSDGIHTFTHVAVMVTAAAAYIYARRRANDRRFAFGTGKAVDLAGFASAVGLAVVALFIGVESVQRLLHPEPVGFEEATIVAVLGLAVGLVSARLLHETDAHDKDGRHLHATPRRDLNLWAAYLHMLADVVTSVLTIGALALGAVLGWIWLDAAVGLINAVVVASFAVQLIRRTSTSLLDMAPPETLAEVRRRLDAGGGAPVDVKLWPIGNGAFALSARTAPGAGLSVAHYRAALADVPHLDHILIETDA